MSVPCPRSLLVATSLALLSEGCSSSTSGGDPPPPARGMRLAPRPAPAPPGTRARRPAAGSAGHSAPMAPPRRVRRRAPAPPPTPAQRMRARLEDHPADHDTREKLARHLLERGDLPAARAELKRLLEVPQRAQVARVLLSRLHRSVNRLDQAKRWGRRAVKGDPKDPEARKHLGLAYLAARERARATTHLEEAVKLAPKRADLWRSLGQVWLERRKHRKAVRALKRASALAPTDPWPQTLLGDAYWGLSLHRQAERAYRKAVTLTGGAPVHRAVALDKLGVLYKQMGRLRRARKVLRACQQMFPHLGCPYTRVALMPANPIRVPGGAPVRKY